MKDYFPECPKFEEALEELHGLNFFWKKIASMFGISRWTIARHVEEFGLTHLQLFSSVSDDDINIMVKDHIKDMDQPQMNHLRVVILCQRGFTCNEDVSEPQSIV